MVVDKKKGRIKSGSSNSSVTAIDPQSEALKALEAIEASRNAIASKLANNLALVRRQVLFSSLANNLVLARSARGFTQAELADIADVSRATIAQIENGSGDPHLSTISAISSALDISPILLLLSKQELIGVIELFKDSDSINNLASGISEKEIELMDLLIKSGLDKNKKRAAKMGSASVAQAGFSAQGAVVGAAIGTVIMPGIGTAIGATLGNQISRLLGD